MAWVVTQMVRRRHIVAYPLSRTKAAAMADHQPDFRPEHRDMIADRLCVRRSDPDVDEGDARAALRDQMIGRHLVTAPIAGRDLRFGVGQISALIMASGNRKRRVGAAFATELRNSEADELVPVA